MRPRQDKLAQLTNETDAISARSALHWDAEYVVSSMRDMNLVLNLVFS